MKLSKILIALALSSLSSYGLADQKFSKSTSTPDPKGKGEAERKAVVEDIDGEKTEALSKPPAKLHLFEVRPTLQPTTGEFHTENTLELGYQSSPDVKWSYVQFFNTNIWNPIDETPIWETPAFAWQDGYFRVKINNLWRSEDKKTSLSYQGRLYLPTLSGTDSTPSKVNQGMITLTRQSLSLTHVFNENFEIDFAYTPSFFIFKRSGYPTATGYSANPWFEHLAVLNLAVKPIKPLSIILPIVLQVTKYRNYQDGAKFNDSWGYNLWTWPEVDYDINEQHTVGVAWESDNFLKPDGTGTHGKSAYQLGIAQVLWNYKF